MRLLRQGHSFSGNERNCVFLNDGAGRFADISALSGLDFPDDGRGVAVTDWDQDGDLDVWLANRTGPRLRFMQNGRLDEAEGRSPLEPASFVAFQLQGTESNRDAIGARVKLRFADADLPAQIQTLGAGDAFLSQSTKWIHFGLPQATGVEQVAVRWPNGSLESFPLTGINCRYRLIEGSGKAEVLKPERRSQIGQDPRRTDDPSAYSPATPTKKSRVRPEATRVVLANRVPIPTLTYSSFGGTDSATMEIRAKGRPLLLLLWSSTCHLCVDELRDMARDHRTWEKEGVDVLALSLDGLDARRSEGPDVAGRLIGDTDFPFSAGLVDASFMERLSVVHEIVFNREPPDAVPASFLLDSESRLAVLYRGRVPIEQVLSDAASLGADLKQRRNLAVPFTGQWLREPKLLSLRAMARLFERRGQIDEFIRYYKLDATSLEQQIERSTNDGQRQLLVDQYVSGQLHLATTYLKLKQTTGAIAHLRNVVQHDTTNVEALTNLGALLAQKEQHAQAIPLLKRAVQLSPRPSSARINLAAALGSTGRFQEARKVLQQILSSQPGAAPAHSQMARWWLEEKNFAAAVEHLQQAVRYQPRDVRSRLQLAWLLATCPVEDIRNGARAVELAGQLERLSAGRDPLVLDVLAAAYAEVGDFQKAQSTCRRALKLLPSSAAGRRQAMESRGQTYRRRQAYRSPDGKQ